MIEPSIPESHKNQECISKRYSTEKDAVSCQRKRSQEMDTEISELGSGIESADSPLRRTVHCLSVREKKSKEWGSSFKPLIPALCLFLRHLYYCQKFPILDGVKFFL